jgi:ABC-type cobalamin transport system ATPase subunit
MTTHDLGRAYRHASHVAILSRGKIGYYGRTDGMNADGLLRIYTETVGVVTV